MAYLLSWYKEKPEPKREVLRFKTEADARKFAEDVFDNDDSILECDIYVPILELKMAEKKIEALKSKIASAVYELNKEWMN